MIDYHLKKKKKLLQMIKAATYLLKDSCLSI